MGKRYEWFFRFDFIVKSVGKVFKLFERWCLFWFYGRLFVLKLYQHNVRIFECFFSTHFKQKKMRNNFYYASTAMKNSFFLESCKTLSWTSNIEIIILKHSQNLIFARQKRFFSFVSASNNLSISCINVSFSKKFVFCNQKSTRFTSWILILWKPKTDVAFS